MLDSPGRCSTFTRKLVPFALLALPLVAAVSDGLNESEAQELAVNGALAWTAPAASPALTGAPPIDALTSFASQFVGLNMNSGLSTVTLTFWIRNGTPSRLVGSSWLVIVIAPVSLSTWITDFTTTTPRLNGPATAGTAIASPNGPSG